MDINRHEAAHRRIEPTPDGLPLAALARMSQAGTHPAILRDYIPVNADIGEVTTILVPEQDRHR